jgi:hypothetical protein
MLVPVRSRNTAVEQVWLYRGRTAMVDLKRAIFEVLLAVLFVVQHVPPVLN